MPNLPEEEAAAEEAIANLEAESPTTPEDSFLQNNPPHQLNEATANMNANMMLAAPMGPPPLPASIAAQGF